MNNKKILSIKAVFITILMCITFMSLTMQSVKATQTRKDNFNKNYSLTGNGPSDMLSIAFAQVGKTGNDLGYSEAWCANFVSDCADLAGQSQAIPRHGAVSNLRDLVINAGGSYVTSPIPGDLVIWKNSISHVEIVSKVENGVVYSIGGNNGGTGNPKTNRVAGERRVTSIGTVTCYVRPNYSGNHVPDPPALSINRNSGTSNDIISITWNAAKYADSYWLHIYRDGADYVNQTLNQDLSYSAKYPVGNYTAYVVSCNSQGETLSSVDFSICDSNPEKPAPYIEKKSYSINETVTITWNKTQLTDSYWLHIYRNGEDYINQTLNQNLSYSATYPVGNYTAFIVSCNGVGETLSSVEFSVYDTAPEKPSPKIIKDIYYTDETVEIAWGEIANTDYYWLHIYRDGKDYINQTLNQNLSYSAAYPAGNYTVYIVSCNGIGETISCVNFSVIKKGDTNADGEFNISDAVLLQKWLLGMSNIEIKNWKAADLCEDDKLDVFDLCIMKHMLIENS